MITNYTVRWYLQDGNPHSAFWFPTLEEANDYANQIKDKQGVSDIRILRAGRNPATPGYTGSRRAARKKAAVARIQGLVPNPEAWIEPEGYVDTEADKHGPPVQPAEHRQQPKTEAEKVNWFRQNPNPFPNAWPAYT